MTKIFETNLPSAELKTPRTHYYALNYKLEYIGLTVLVARLSEGLPFGEHDGHSQILEGGHIEEGGVLVVPDVFVVVRTRHVRAVRGSGAGNVAGAEGDERRDEVHPDRWRDERCPGQITTHCSRHDRTRYSLRLRRPRLVPALLPHQEESQDLEHQAGDDLGQN